jgi:hypothetical protein
VVRLPFATAVLVVWSLVSCEDGAPKSRLLVGDAQSPVALAALPGGGLRYGERLTGRVREVDGRRRLRPEPLAELDVSTEGQRGLLGLAVDSQDRTFAAWTDPQKRIVVGRVAPGPVHIVWEGPASTRIGNGGHLAFSPAGVLVVGIGDLQRGDRSGRLLALDPDGPSDQEPQVISPGWNNPFAFAFSPAGSLWVADNAPGEEPEGLVRVGPGGQPAFSRALSDRQIAPAGLVALSDTRLVVCAYLPAQLIFYDVDGGRRRKLADDCRTGVVRLTTGDLAFAGDDEIRVLDDPLS